MATKQKRQKSIAAAQAALVGEKITLENLLAKIRLFHDDGREQHRIAKGIRMNKEWKVMLDDNGKQLYKTFDEFCRVELGVSRVEITHRTNWLRVRDYADTKGLHALKFSKSACEGFFCGRVKEAGGMEVCFDEAIADGIPFTRDALRDMVIKRADWNYYQSADYQGKKPKAETYEQWKRDIAITEGLPGNGDHSVLGEAERLGGDWGQNLLKLCKEKRVIPYIPSLWRGQLGLTQVASGDQLKEMVDELLAGR